VVLYELAAHRRTQNIPYGGCRVADSGRLAEEVDSESYTIPGMSPRPGSGIEIRGPLPDTYKEILSDEALQLLADLHRKFDGRRRELLARRVERQKEINAGKLPAFLPETANVRNSEWTVAPIPTDLQDRRTEITGPVDRKMIINALNSGASVFMADFEDANSPTWANCIEGHRNLRDAINKTISLSSGGKDYKLNDKTAVLLIRPRGWHLTEKHVFIDGERLSASMFDFALYFFHNAKQLVKNGSGPYFYLPKLESHLEARLWNDVFNLTQDACGVPRGTIRATVLIETILGAFEMDEILYELRDHSAGLNCGRWDYIFSFIKKFRDRPDFLMPDRATVTMEKHFLDSYVRLLIKTCHRRGIHAMGGMSAFIPVKNDPELNDRALDKVRQDKLREVNAGHDGTWVAHPGLVTVAKEVFDEHMPAPNQIANKRSDVNVSASDLLRVPEGPITEHGLRLNVDVGIQYIAAWLNGNGAVPIYNLMEDAATAEISRTQVWQWIRHRARLDDGREITPELVQSVIAEETAKLQSKPKVQEASKLFASVATPPDFPDFLTLSAYEQLD
jgi:malate synthase